MHLSPAAKGASAEWGLVKSTFKFTTLLILVSLPTETDAKVQLVMTRTTKVTGSPSVFGKCHLLDPTSANGLTTPYSNPLRCTVLLCPF